MSTHPVRAIAAEAARSVGRRLRARRRQGPLPVRTRGHVSAAPAAQERERAAGKPAPGPVQILDPETEAESQAPDAELDALRGALVRELDRLAADDDCSASFRRA
jgi:hypothetical protein